MTISISKQINPYIIGRPIYEPEHFFGRNDLFAFIQDNLSQKTKVILLHGQRRIGKSSVLSQVPNFVKLDNFVFVILSLEGKSKKSLNDVLYELAKEIKSYLEDELEFSVQNIEIAKREVFQEDRDVFTRDFLPQVYEVLGNKNLVLLLDEFDVLEDGAKDAAIDHFFPYLRSIIDKQNYLYIIPVVGRRLDDIPSLLQLFHEAPHQEIGLLRRENAEKLILEPAKGILTYEEDAVDTILELTSGHPYFTQVVCFALFSKAREDERTIITREDVEGIVDRAIELGEGGLTWFRDGLEIPERVVLLAATLVQATENIIKQEHSLILLKNHGIIITQEFFDAEKNLVKWGFLNEFKPYFYKISIELVRYWFSKRFSINQAIQELETIDLDVNAIYHKALKLKQEDPKQSLDLYEQVIEKNPNHFSALLELAKIYFQLFYFKNAKKIYERIYRFDPILSKTEYSTSLKFCSKDNILNANFEIARLELETITKISKEDSIFSMIASCLTKEFLLDSEHKDYVISISHFLEASKEQQNKYDIPLVENGYSFLKRVFREHLSFNDEDLEYFDAQYKFWISYQKKLESYTQAILEAKYRKATIELTTRNKLYQLQQELSLKDEDAKKIRQRFMEQIENEVENAKEIYRQEFEKLIHNGNISTLDRKIMDLHRQELGLIQIETEAIEQEILEPYQGIQRKIMEYKGAVYTAMKSEHYPDIMPKIVVMYIISRFRIPKSERGIIKKSKLTAKLNKIQYLLDIDKDIANKIDREVEKNLVDEYLNKFGFKSEYLIAYLFFAFFLIALVPIIIFLIYDGLKIIFYKIFKRIKNRNKVQ